ncbi:aminoacyl-tRNA hydrolase [Wandonia haliotis]|uniref:Peptidyl-tRNA hydrolase n=1 Tax=Wandonia haliotis TaxID=574963 RepID=A0ABN1MMV7_9FLAO
MKYLVVGLGNPGSKYENTRHNIGFKVLDAFAKEIGEPFYVEKHAEVARCKYKGRQIILVKPTTYMNLSGKAVNYWMQQENIPLDRVMVVTDDIALPFGKLRMKGKGSDGGHNGLKDIQAVLNTNLYARLRFGVGDAFFPGQQSDYVLGEWSKEESEKLEERIKTATEFIKGFCTVGIQLTMTNWNGK